MSKKLVIKLLDQRKLEALNLLPLFRKRSNQHPATMTPDISCTEIGHNQRADFLIVFALINCLSLYAI